MCKTLQAIATEFVRHASKEKGITLDPKDGPGGKLFTFGSYRLGVFGPGDCPPLSAHALRLRLHTTTF